MCIDTFLFCRSGTVIECGTQAELAAATGLHDLPMLDGTRDLTANDCLCPVSIEAVGKEIGWLYEPPAYTDATDHFDADALRELI
jgi:hypothetical protein